MRRTAAALASAALTLGAATPPRAAEPPPSAPDIIQATYRCERGALLPMVYVNPPGGPAYAIALIEGRQVPMRHAPSGSGARYIAVDEQQSYRWHSKGREGILSFLAADHTATEETLLRDCHTD